MLILRPSEGVVNVKLYKSSPTCLCSESSETPLLALSCLPYLSVCPYTWCVQVLRSPKEASAAAMQSWRERCEKCVCLQSDYTEK